LVDSPGPLPRVKSAKPNVVLGPLLDSHRPLPLAQSAKPDVKIPDDSLIPSALKRREERRLRESEELRLRERRLNRYSQPKEVDMKIEDDMSEIDRAGLEEASPIAEAPEFDGPEPISETLDYDFSGIIQYHPFVKGHGSIDVSKSPSYRLNLHLIDSLVGGDYSKYTSLSSISNSTNALTVVNTAELALSRQPDYIIPQRKQAIEIVKNLVEANKAGKLSDDIELTTLLTGKSVE
jgi:hypothetical protein